MNEFHTQLQIPKTPGTYWVVRKQLIRQEGTIKVYQYCDRSYAKWDGMQWDYYAEYIGILNVHALNRTNCYHSEEEEKNVAV
jgi:lipase chaperone LimK